MMNELDSGIQIHEDVHHSGNVSLIFRSWSTSSLKFCLVWDNLSKSALSFLCSKFVNCLIHNIRIGYPKRSGSNILSTFLCSIMLPFVQYLLFEQLSNHRIGLEVLGIPSQQPILKLFVILSSNYYLFLEHSFLFICKSTNLDVFAEFSDISTFIDKRNQISKFSCR